jgi:oxygen-independent coproporphyrinogen-3 oxidase
MDGGSGVGLYIHIPFCQAKCTYCDFNSYAGLETLFDDYTTALVRQMDQAGPVRAKTIYIGGGTPTVLPLSHLAQIVGAVHKTFAAEADAEVSIEANPGTLNAEKLAQLRHLGVNRLSLGVQSFGEQELRLLGRIHDRTQAVEAFRTARQLGFENINLDLLYGLPRQSLASWQASLESGLRLQPDHLSLYALTVEEDTPLASTISQGALPAPDPDLAADMYESAQDLLQDAGYVHYEISNWARTPGVMCQHNLAYWRNEPYIGLGAGAHSWRRGRRWSNTALPAQFVAQVLDGETPIESEEEIDPALEMGETMMMGLRLLDEGVGLERFRERFGVALEQKYADELAELRQLGLIEVDGERVRLSERGRLLGNQVFLRFLPG